MKKSTLKSIALSIITFLAVCGSFLNYDALAQVKKHPNRNMAIPFNNEAESNFQKTTETQWKGSDGRNYFIRINDNIFKESETSVQRSYHSSIAYVSNSGRRIVFEGMLNPNSQTTRLTFRPKTLDDIEFQGSEDLRRQALNDPNFKFIAHILNHTKDKIEIVILLPKIRKKGEKISILPSGQSHKVTLTQEDKSYKIGKIYYDNTIFKNRQKEGIETLESEKEKLEVVLSDLKKKSEIQGELLGKNSDSLKAVKDKISTLQEETASILSQLSLRSEVLSKNSEKKEIKKIEKEIDALVTVLESYQSAELHKNLINKRGQLKKLQGTTKEKLASDITLNTLRAKLKDKNRQKNILRTQLIALEEKNDSNIEQDILLKNQIVETEYNIGHLTYKMATFYKNPTLQEIRVYTPDNKLIYIGESGLDTELLKTLDDELKQVQKDIEDKKNNISQNKQDMSDIHLDFRVKRKFLMKASSALDKAAETLSEEIVDNMYLKIGAQLVADTVDLVMAGNPAGIAAEGAQKVAVYLTAWGTGQDPLTTYDESELRGLFKEQFETYKAEGRIEEIRGNSTQRVTEDIKGKASGALSSNLKSHAISTGIKMPYVLLQKQGMDKLEERKTRLLYETLEKELKKAEASVANDKVLEGILNDVEKKAKELPTHVTEAYNSKNPVTKKRATDVIDKKMGTLKRLQEQRDVLQEQIRKNRQALSMKNNFKPKAQFTKEVQKKSSGSFKKSLAIGFAVDLAKAGIITYLDDQERDLWVDFFEKEMTFKAAEWAAKGTSVKYWGLQDEIDIDEQYIAAQNSLILELLRMKGDYQNSIYEYGLFVKQNESFTPEKHNNLKLVLKFSESKADILVRLSATSLEDATFIDGSKVSTGDFREWGYTIPLAQLSELQNEPGPVPLLIHQK